MGHLIWNRVIDGKLTHSKGTDIILSQKEKVFIIGTKSEKSEIPIVMEVSIEEVIKSAEQNFSINAGIFLPRHDKYGKIMPKLIFPYKWNDFFVKNKEIVYGFSGDYFHENDEMPMDFVADLYGSLFNPISKIFDCQGRTLGWCTIWWTNDRREANRLLGYIKSRKVY